MTASAQASGAPSELASADGSGTAEVVIPSEYPPPVDSAREFVAEPTDPEEERIEVGVAIVGGGPAGLACANRLLQLLAEDEELAERLGEVPVAVLEKGKACGAHNLSGAVMRPSAMAELFAGLEPSDWPNYGEVTDEAVYLMVSDKRSVRIPTPPNFRNHGNYVISVAELSRWLADRAEEAGAYILTETAAEKLLVDDGTRSWACARATRAAAARARSSRTSSPGPTWWPRRPSWPRARGATSPERPSAASTWAQTTPRCGPSASRRSGRCPTPLTKVVHTMGWPLRAQARYHEFGGSWIYPMGEDKVSIGFVAGLDCTDATISVHDVLQLFKTHPRVRAILEGGKRISWGAKAIPEGGYWAMPTLHAPGMVICGDSGGMVNVPELKGVHYAMHSGILAAARDLRGAQGRLDRPGLLRQRRARLGHRRRPLPHAQHEASPSRGAFSSAGRLANAMLASGGRFPGGHWRTSPDAEQPVFDGGRSDTYAKPDGKLHLRQALLGLHQRQRDARRRPQPHQGAKARGPRTLAQTWAWMCPAAVYEIPEDAPEKGPVDVIVNYTNCVQCGAITAKGGRLTPPEGGDGPLYRNT